MSIISKAVNKVLGRGTTSAMKMAIKLEQERLAMLDEALERAERGEDGYLMRIYSVNEQSADVELVVFFKDVAEAESKVFCKEALNLLSDVELAQSAYKWLGWTDGNREESLEQMAAITWEQYYQVVAEDKAMFNSLNTDYRLKGIYQGSFYEVLMTDKCKAAIPPQKELVEYLLAS